MTYLINIQTFIFIVYQQSNIDVRGNNNLTTHLFMGWFPFLTNLQLCIHPCQHSSSSLIHKLYIQKYRWVMHF